MQIFSLKKITITGLIFLSIAAYGSHKSKWIWRPIQKERFVWRKVAARNTLPKKDTLFILYNRVAKKFLAGQEITLVHYNDNNPFITHTLQDILPAPLIDHIITYIYAIRTTSTSTFGHIPEVGSGKQAIQYNTSQLLTVSYTNLPQDTVLICPAIHNTVRQTVQHSIPRTQCEHPKIPTPPATITALNVYNVIDKPPEEIPTFALLIQAFEQEPTHFHPYLTIPGAPSIHGPTPVTPEKLRNDGSSDSSGSHPSQNDSQEEDHATNTSPTARRSLFRTGTPDIYP